MMGLGKEQNGLPEYMCNHPKYLFRFILDSSVLEYKLESVEDK